MLMYKNFLRLRFFQPNMSLSNRVLGVLVCLCVHVLWCAHVLTCLHTRMLGVFTCICVWCVHVLICLRVPVWFVSLCAHMFCMLAVLEYLTCLHACVLRWHHLSYFLCIWRVNFQKSLYIKIYFYSKKYLEPTWTSMKEFLAKKN